ncbi:Glycosyl transferase family 41 [Phytophthora infestans]|uniref:Glycosyl transferase family 41 n=1 Tax=Phytophthora infestans TaxID=4787 RepID=A0A8S9UT94_PHYIN|nr:Glycosyl transferase family 41 [Phytophthora infestans]
MRWTMLILCCVLSVSVLDVVIAASKQPTLPVGECVAQILAAPDTTEAAFFPFRCQLAAFGAYLPDETKRMTMILAPDDNSLGCSPLLDISNRKYSKVESTAVIVRRGECSFQKKLENVAAVGAAMMILVNSEDTLIPLSSLEYEHTTTAAVSTTKSEGEKLIEMVKEMSEIGLKVAAMGLVDQARSRLQFLVDINAPVVVYEEFNDVMELLEPIVGTLDDLLSTMSTVMYQIRGTAHSAAEAKELVDFFSFSAKQLSKWRFASEAALHASVAAAALQIQVWTNEPKTVSRSDRLLLHTAALKLTESGYYSHSISLLEKILLLSDSHIDTSVQCLLLFLKFLQGNVIASVKGASGCKTSELKVGIPSLKVAQEAFNRLAKLTRSSHDEECLRLAAGLLNDTNLALTCCHLKEQTTDHTGSLPRQFSSEFTEDLFHSLVMMGVFLDELGPFKESLRFFENAARLCPGDRTTLELRQLLAVPIVFSSQNDMDLFIAELKKKLHIFTEALLKKQNLKELAVLPLGNADESDGALKLGKPNRALCPEQAAYLQYTITPPTMFIGYQGIDVLPIQRAIHRLRSLVYPSLSSSFEPQNPGEIWSDDAHRRRRVAFISSWLRAHSVGKLLLGVVQNLDRAKFHVVIYHCVHFLRDADEITELFKHTADEFVELPENQDTAVQILRQAHLDIVIFPELGMDEWTVLLSHHRVAPVQCAFWGHPITTGNPQIDYFLSSEHFVSEQFDEPTESTPRKLSGYRRSSFSEQVVLFRGLSTIFTEPKTLAAESREITRSRLFLPTNRRLYVCPQTLMKLHPAFDDALAGILSRDDKAIIVLLASDTQLVWMEKLRRRFRLRFGPNTRRVLFLPTLPFAEFQALLTLADVVLDPFPFGGGVTTLDALHLGIPVVTLPAAQSVVHLAAGFLRYMNASDCIANSLDEYVQLAVSIATDHEEIQKRLLLHRSDIYRDVSTIEDWNTFLVSRLKNS